ncbi:hypothetical protein [Acinetobacter lwoffii]|uniref:SH3 domain protein n=1 Tax=Acinetobacter lwoffii TaxID=28090 RepID=A0A6N1MEY3_ACILW|nr:hypothetical protein [Acinetobacter lwoffii]QKU20648.1 hypothetical protein FOB19_03920 [Acinetobacter lwoffii]
MRVVTASIIGLCFMISPVWAVEVVPAPVTLENQTAQPQGTAATAQTQSTPKPAIIPAVASSAQSMPPAGNKPLTAEEIAKLKAQQDAKVKALVKDQATRLQQLEKANLEALSQNQELQLKNDNLGVQVQVLQSERSAQMFLYGAATLAVGVLLGFLIASYVYTKRRRQW